MNQKQQKELVGVLGGMGPMATVEFYRNIVEACHVNKDQDHVPVVIWADPTVPDRSNAILGIGDDPTQALRRGTEKLLSLGVTRIVVPCNTAHAFMGTVIRDLNVEFIDLIQNTVERIAAQRTSKAIGILATEGTIRSNLYQTALRDRGLEPLQLTSGQMQQVYDAIALVKAGKIKPAARLLEAALQDLRDAGAQGIIAGCTEIPIALAEISSEFKEQHQLPPVYDPMKIVAQLIVQHHMEGVELHV